MSLFIPGWHQAQELGMQLLLLSLSPPHIWKRINQPAKTTWHKVGRPEVKALGNWLLFVLYLLWWRPDCFAQLIKTS